MLTKNQKKELIDKAEMIEIVLLALKYLKEGELYIKVKDNVKELCTDFPNKWYIREAGQVFKVTDINIYHGCDFPMVLIGNDKTIDFEHFDIVDKQEFDLCISAQAEIEANKKGFKIGDKVCYFSNSLSKIKSTINRFEVIDKSIYNSSVIIDWYYDQIKKPFLSVEFSHFAVPLDLCFKEIKDISNFELGQNVRYVNNKGVADFSKIKNIFLIAKLNLLNNKENFDLYYKEDKPIYTVLQLENGLIISQEIATVQDTRYHDFNIENNGPVRLLFNVKTNNKTYFINHNKIDGSIHILLENKNVCETYIDVIAVIIENQFVIIDDVVTINGFEIGLKLLYTIKHVINNNK